MAELVEWRVFLPVNTSAAAPTPLSQVLLGELFHAWPVEAEDGVEDRTDNYLLVGSDGVGLKHRGKKGKLEVKVLTQRWGPAECLGVVGGVEGWRKYKLGKAHKGEGKEEGEACMRPAQREELQQILAEHGLLDAGVQRALQQTGAGAPPQEVAVAKSRLVGRLRLEDALVDHGDGSDGEGAAPSASSSLAQRLLQRVVQGSSGSPASSIPASVNVDAELLVEDCVLEVEGAGSTTRMWRSYQVEGPRQEVIHFLAASPLGRAMHAFADHPGAIVAGYPAWLGHVVGGDGEAACAGPAAEGSCAAMIARVTSSAEFPIPPLPPNPHGGVKEHFKLKQVALVVVRHPTTGKYLAVEEQDDKGWWLPAGHVDPNERFDQAAYREALEEAGIGVRLEGVLRVEHKLTAPTKGRLRVVYFGTPIHPDAPLKSVPDEESRSARWVTLAELRRLPLRSKELVHWIEYLEAGGTIYPLSLFAGENEPVPVPK